MRSQPILGWTILQAGCALIANPTALDNEVLLNNIIFKSQLLSTVKEELNGSELKPSTCLRQTLRAIKSECFKDHAVVGVRIELREDSTVNGVEALEKLKKTGERVYTYSLPAEITLQVFS